MKAKVTLIVEYGVEKHTYFENSMNVDYNGVIELINEASIRAEEVIIEKIQDEMNE